MTMEKIKTGYAYGILEYFNAEPRVVVPIDDDPDPIFDKKKTASDRPEEAGSNYDPQINKTMILTITL